MKKRFLSVIICFLIFSTNIFSCISISAENTVYKAQNFADSIVNYKLKQSGANSIQNWIDGELTENAGQTAEWYILGLSQSGKYDFSLYQNALKNYLKNNEVYSAVSRQKYALVLIATGSSDKYIAEVLNNSIGKQGIMSWVYGLHLINNGYKSSNYTTNEVKDKILSLQLSNGGWAVMGANSDTDVTAMTIQALAPYRKTDSNVKTAIEKAVDLLSERQLEDGDYSSYGIPNLESTAQVITALSSLGIDCEQDSRFIKNGNSLFDGLEKYRSFEGSFYHKVDGGVNDTATTQAYYSLIAYIRMCQGKSGAYILDNSNPNAFINDTVTQATSKPATIIKETTSKNKPEKIEISETKKSQKTDKNKKTNVIEDSTEITEKSTEKVKNKKKNNPTEINEATILATENDDFKFEQNREEKIEIANKKTVKEVSYKPMACFILLSVGVIICLFLFFAKKRNKKNFIAVIILTILAIAFVIFTDFKSTDTYYNGKTISKENAVGTVTMTIRCDTLVGKANSEYIPQNGIILDTTEFKIEENTSAYDILTEAARKYNIHVDNSGSEEMAYIAGLNYLYEFQFGDRSGWIFYINGKSPSVGCGEYILSDGDQIEWLYSCELGKDLK